MLVKRGDFRFSVVIPVFNRAEKIGRAIRSVQRAAAVVGERAEIVVADDASTDDSARLARCAGATTVVSLAENVGVTGARNRGIALSTGEFVVILDSDDELTPDALLIASDHFRERPTTDILFGACVDRRGCLMHSETAPIGPVQYVELLTNRFAGEFMPIARRSVFETISFEERLRGFEGVTWLKMARFGCRLWFTRAVVRVYDCDGDDRLCRRANRLKRAAQMADGWGVFLTEFGYDLWRQNRTACLGLVLRWMTYQRIAGRRTANEGRALSSIRSPVVSALAGLIRLVLLVAPVRAMLSFYGRRSDSGA